MQHIVHAHSGNIAHYFRLQGAGEGGKFILGFLKASQQIAVMSSHERLKEIFLAPVVAVESAGSHPERSDYAAQRGSGKAFLQEFRSGSLMDAFECCQMFCRHIFSL